jgi:hypothetical protein
MGGGQARKRGYRDGGALVFAVLAGWWRIPSPPVTASGSPDRLLCPDPVRYMSVISGSIEPTIVYVVACAVGSNVSPMSILLGFLAGQRGINEHSTGR